MTDLRTYLGPDADPDLCPPHGLLRPRLYPLPFAVAEPRSNCTVSVRGAGHRETSGALGFTRTAARAGSVTSPLTDHRPAADSANREEVDLFNEVATSAAGVYDWAADPEVAG